MEFIYNCELDYPIGSMYNYSDLGFILLAEIAERVIGGPLEDYSKILLERIGLVNSTFLPDLNEILYRIAPTEYSRTSAWI
jgi:CubicO group peptidase (beta-lactamase class C family)